MAKSKYNTGKVIGKAIAGFGAGYYQGRENKRDRQFQEREFAAKENNRTEKLADAEARLANERARLELAQQQAALNAKLKELDLKIKEYDLGDRPARSADRHAATQSLLDSRASMGLYRDLATERLGKTPIPGTEPPKPTADEKKVEARQGAFFPPDPSKSAIYHPLYAAAREILVESNPQHADFDQQLYAKIQEKLTEMEGTVTPEIVAQATDYVLKNQRAFWDMEIKPAKPGFKVGIGKWSKTLGGSPADTTFVAPKKQPQRSFEELLSDPNISETEKMMLLIQGE